jgi:hypothetical protein
LTHEAAWRGAPGAAPPIGYISVSESEQEPASSGQVCYARAANEVEADRCELTAELNDDQAARLKRLLGTQRQVSEIEYHTLMEQVLAHLADPGRTYRAIYLHCLESGGDPAACCADRPELPFSDDDE